MPDAWPVLAQVEQTTVHSTFSTFWFSQQWLAMAKIGELFISHTHADAEIAHALSEAIEGIFGDLLTTSYSTKKEVDGDGKIKPGEEWFRWIVERVRNANVAVIVLTPSSTQKRGSCGKPEQSTGQASLPPAPMRARCVPSSSSFPAARYRPRSPAYKVSTVTSDPGSSCS